MANAQARVCVQANASSWRTGAAKGSAMLAGIMVPCRTTPSAQRLQRNSVLGAPPPVPSRAWATASRNNPDSR